MRTHIFAVVSLACLVGCKPSEPAPSASVAVPQWEYMEKVSLSKSFPKEELNKLGSEGWELVSYNEERQNGYYTKYVFKRLVTTSQPAQAAPVAAGNPPKAGA